MGIKYTCTKSCYADDRTARLEIQKRYKSRLTCGVRDRSARKYKEEYCDQCKAWHITEIK